MGWDDRPWPFGYRRLVVVALVAGHGTAGRFGPGDAGCAGQLGRCQAFRQIGVAQADQRVLSLRSSPTGIATVLLISRSAKFDLMCCTVALVNTASFRKFSYSRVLRATTRIR